jgi:hypothetical protein
MDAEYGSFDRRAFYDDIVKYVSPEASLVLQIT